jgi:hypothetical protein
MSNTNSENRNALGQWLDRFAINTQAQSGQAPEQQTNQATTTDNLVLHAEQAIRKLPAAEQSTEHANLVMATQLARQLAAILQPAEPGRVLSGDAYFQILTDLAAWQSAWIQQLAGAGENSPAHHLVLDTMLLFRSELIGLWENEHERHDQQMNLWHRRVTNDPSPSESMKAGQAKREWRNGAATLMQLCKWIEDWKINRTVSNVITHSHR